MPKVVMYCTRTCPYCIRAERLLTQKGVDLEKIDVGGRPELWKEMEKRSGRNTVPQIWIGDIHVGGCDDLHALEKQGKLDALLSS
ncbi:MAG: glutaredoxin 3 [Gammaproteobacteria bacterium]|nr:MAG: glutaredoxin 3 [Gammaproteobacteria bacterium]